MADVEGKTNSTVAFSFGMEALAASLASALGLDTADRHDGGPTSDFFATAWLAIALLAIRVTSERVMIPILTSILKDKKKASHIFDDSFIAFFSALLEAFAVINTVLFNGGKNKMGLGRPV